MGRTKYLMLLPSCYLLCGFEFRIATSFPRESVWGLGEQGALVHDSSVEFSTFLELKVPPARYFL